MNYVTKTTNYTSHKYSLMKIGVQKIEEMYSKTSNDHLRKRHHLIIHSLNTISSQQ